MQFLIRCRLRFRRALRAALTWFAGKPEVFEPLKICPHCEAAKERDEIDAVMKLIDPKDISFIPAGAVKNLSPCPVHEFCVSCCKSFWIAPKARFYFWHFDKRVFAFCPECWPPTEELSLD